MDSAGAPPIARSTSYKRADPPAVGLDCKTAQLPRRIDALRSTVDLCRRGRAAFFRTGALRRGHGREFVHHQVHHRTRHQGISTRTTRRRFFTLPAADGAAVSSQATFSTSFTFPAHAGHPDGRSRSTASSATRQQLVHQREPPGWDSTWTYLVSGLRQVHGRFRSGRHWPGLDNGLYCTP